MTTIDPMRVDPRRVNDMLTRTMAGEADAERALIGVIYDELHAIAERLMAQERANHTLQATALVHEVFVRLAEGATVDSSCRDRFMGLACSVMRHILVDHARGKRRLKRGGAGVGPDAGGAGGGAVRVSLAAAEGEAAFDRDTGELLALHEALEKLAALDERKARLVELRFFGGLAEADAARVLGISRATASADWRFARAWLAAEMGEGQAG